MNLNLTECSSTLKLKAPFFVFFSEFFPVCSREDYGDHRLPKVVYQVSNPVSIRCSFFLMPGETFWGLGNLCDFFGKNCSNFYFSMPLRALF